MQVADLSSDEAKQSVLDTLAQSRREVRYWRGQAGVDADTPTPDSPPPPRAPPLLRENVSRKYSRARAKAAAAEIGCAVERLPVKEQALAFDAAIRQQGPTVQAAVSALPFAKQEQFIGARRVLRVQRNTAQTVDASVDCRLEVPLSFQKLHDCNTFLSRRRRPNGSLERIVVMPIPSPVHEARKRGIRTPLFCARPLPSRTGY